MRSPQPISRLLRCCSCGLALLVAGTAAAQPTPAADGAWALPSSKEEIVHSLTDTVEKFGPDVVLLQTYLLNETLRSGSILETTISAPSIEERGEKHYVGLTLDSGLIFNDRLLQRDARVARVWEKIVGRAVRRHTTFKVPADGVAIRVNYHHKPYTDETVLRQHLQKRGRGQPESVVFFLRTSEIERWLDDGLSPQELLDHSEVLLDQQPYPLRLPPSETAEPPS